METEKLAHSATLEVMDESWIMFQNCDVAIFHVDAWTRGHVDTWTRGHMDFSSTWMRGNVDSQRGTWILNVDA
jgi:hypothetical protein